MNIRKELLKEHSRKNAEGIAEFALQQQERLEILFSIMEEGESRLLQKATWPLSIIGEKKPAWFIRFLPKIILHLRSPSHPSVSRNLYRIVQHMQIPEEHQADLYDLSIRDLSDPATPVAVKVFCMTVAYHITQEYPDLKNELKLVIEEQLAYSSPGYRSRARKILPQL